MRRQGHIQPELCAQPPNLPDRTPVNHMSVRPDDEESVIPDDPEQPVNKAAAVADRHEIPSLEYYVWSMACLAETIRRANVKRANHHVLDAAILSQKAPQKFSGRAVRWLGNTPDRQDVEVSQEFVKRPFAAVSV